MRRLIAALMIATSPISGDVSSGQSISSSCALTVQDPRCEYAVNPVGIDAAEPRLSWILQSDERGQRPSAYQIWVASDPAKLAPSQADLWDSGRVESDESTHVPYAGKPLASGQRCYWKVRVWDRTGRATADSETAWWEMGLLKPSDWQAQWIAGLGAPDISPYLRKSFRIDDRPVEARLYITSLGYHQIYLNGRLVGDHRLDPIQSDFSRRVYYVTHDLKDYLVAGENVIGVGLGHGWYRKGVHGVTLDRPALLAQLIVTSSDGSRTVLGTDVSWKTSDGPVTSYGSFPFGESYDARKEMFGWDRAGFDDQAWASAQIVAVPPLTLSSQMIVPNRVTATFQPVAVNARESGEYLVDFGRNLTGWFQLRLRGTPGQQITLTYYASHLGQATHLTENMNQVDKYICKGTDTETFCNQYNYRAFRYVLVAGLAAAPELADATASLIQTDTPGSGAFECSDARLNRLHELVVHTHRCLTLGGIQVDCPHRERLGYGAEGQASMEQALYNFDMAAFYTKWARDFQDGQEPLSGQVDYTAPFRIDSGGGPAWSGACVVYPWQVYLYYGDRQILERHYDSMLRWLGFLESHAPQTILEYFSVPAGLKDSIWNFLADWASPRRPDDTLPCSGHWPTASENTLFNNCNYYMNVSLVAKIAGILGRPGEAQALAEKANRIKQAILDQYFDARTGRYTAGEQQQAYLALPLLLDLTPAPHREQVLDNLVKDILVTRQGHLDVGVLGSYHLLAALIEEDRSDLIYLMATQKSWPGWGDLVERGATTLWEHWLPGDSSVHNSFLSIGAWFYQGLAGIRPDPLQPGFKNVLLAPAFIKDVNWVKARYDSIRGPIESQWERKDGRVSFSIALPPNTTATVHVPATSADDVRENGQAAASSEGVRFVRLERGKAIFSVSSGRYCFDVPDPHKAASLVAADGSPLAEPGATGGKPSPLSPANLRCEYRTNPLGVDASEPRLSWRLQSMDPSARGQRQGAYQVLVATESEKLEPGRADLWDSGKVDSAQSVHVRYAGLPLRSGQRCQWAVRIWDEQGQASAWSHPASWSMGLLETEDWKGQWIACPLPAEPMRSPLLRAEFDCLKPVKSALAYVSGLGYFELYLNGKKVGDSVLDPGVTDYDRRLLYVVHDVTPLLRQGRNATGLMLGNGWFNVETPGWGFENASWKGAPRARLQFEIEFEDGTNARVVTGPDWTAVAGPVTYNDLRAGEVYDGREEKPRWSQPGYDDRDWGKATVVEGPRGRVSVQNLPPITIRQTFEPATVTEPKSGIYVYDLGQNIAGWARIRLDGRGHRGQAVRLRFSGRLLADGTVETHAFAHRDQLFTCFLKGESEEVYEPRFVYYGFQYVQVEGAPGPLGLDNLAGRHVCTSVEPAGEFACANPLINRVQRNIRWTQLNNMHSYPTDCPNREKLGWTADAHVTAEEAIFNFDCATFYTKYVQDLFDSQAANGGVHKYSPIPNARDSIDIWDAPTWSGACVIIPWYLYLYYGDTEPFARYYPELKRYVDSIPQTMGTDRLHIVTGGPGDWLAPNNNVLETPEGTMMIGTAYYYYCADLLSKMASVLDQPGDARKYADLARQIADALNAAFFDPQAGIYHGDRPTPYRQTPNALALFLGMVPQPYYETVVSNLVADIVVTQEGRLNTGFPGTKVLMEVLPQIGRADLAYQLAAQTEYPSWIWPILEYGATTIPEWWDGNVPRFWTQRTGFGLGTRNHPAFGSVGAYYYKYLAGIRPDPKAPGFKHILIQPEIAGGLDWARATYPSLYGPIRSEWRLEGDRLTLEVGVPPNTSATVWVPTANPEQVRESDRPLRQAEDVEFLRFENKAAICRVGSGNYRFGAPRP